MLWFWFGFSFIGQFAAMYVWYTANRGTMHDAHRRHLIPYCLVAYVLISIVTGVGLIVALEGHYFEPCSQRFERNQEALMTVLNVVVVCQLVDMALCILGTALLYTISWKDEWDVTEEAQGQSQLVGICTSLCCIMRCLTCNLAGGVGNDHCYDSVAQGHIHDVAEVRPHSPRLPRPEPKANPPG